jgi:perosamine synthetase
MSDFEPIPLSGPEIGAREEELVLEVLRSGWLSLGPMGERFERAFAEFLGVEDAVAVSSGTAALHLGVRQLGWGPGDEVVTSPFTFVASANCLLYEGAVPVFVDVDPVTLDIDPDAAAAAVTERTAGLLPIDIFGWPAAWPELEALAERHGLGVLEDSCEALGAIDSEDPGAAARLRSERNQGRAVDMGWLDHDRLGFNYRLSDVQAAIGLAQVEKLPRLLERRAGVAAAYAERLAEVPGVEAPLAARGREVRSWFVYVVRLADEVDRDAVIRGLRERGIDSKSYLPSVHRFPHLAELGYREGQFPVAEAASAHCLALPFFPSLGEAQIERVCTELAAAVDAAARPGPA